MLRTVTVPADAVDESFGITGNSFIIVNAPAYEAIEDVPLIGFNSPGDQLPALTRSIYGNPRGKFNRLAITGTAESAGDEITIFSTAACLDDFINIDALLTRRVRAGTSFHIDSTNIAKELPEVSLLDSDGNLPSKIYVSATANDIKFAFNASPDQGDDDLGTYLKSGEPAVEIEGVNFITSFEFISAVADAHGSLTVHLEY